MRTTLKFLGALIVALIGMLAFRALAFTIYTVPCKGLEPAFFQGDRVMVNRWSYGLRTGGEGLFAYARILRQPVERGDIVALNDSSGQVIICRCTAVPGDSLPMTTSSAASAKTVVPGKVSCANQDYYAMQPLSPASPHAHNQALPSTLVPEQNIIGRVCLIVYNHNDSLPFWRGYHPNRWMLYP